MPLARQTWFNGRKTAKLAHFERPQTRERADQSEQRKKNVLDETRFPCDFLLFLGALFFVSSLKKENNNNNNNNRSVGGRARESTWKETESAEPFCGFHNRLVPSFTVFFPSVTGFYWVLPSCTGSYWDWLGLTGFLPSLLRFTGSCLVLLGFTQYYLVFIQFY